MITKHSAVPNYLLIIVVHAGNLCSCVNKALRKYTQFRVWQVQYTSTSGIYISESLYKSQFLAILCQL